MRWHFIDKPQPKVGDRRIVRCFLFFPKCINSEWRWLEFAGIWQTYGWAPPPIYAVTFGDYYAWLDEAWA